MAGKFRFCHVCRSDDLADLLTCAGGCKHRFHLECANVSIREKDGWVCNECESGVAVGAASKRSKGEKDRSNAIKKFHGHVLHARGAFLSAHRSAFEPFVESTVLNNVIQKSNGKCDDTIEKTADAVDNSFTRQVKPAYIKNGTLRDYQFEGTLLTMLSIVVHPNHKQLITLLYINNGIRREGTRTMLSWCARGVGGILADEMGLGKTIQCITMLATLKHRFNVTGPHLVVTPLAVLQVPTNTWSYVTLDQIVF